MQVCAQAAIWVRLRALWQWLPGAKATGWLAASVATSQPGPASCLHNARCGWSGAVKIGGWAAVAGRVTVSLCHYATGIFFSRETIIDRSGGVSGQGVASGYGAVGFVGFSGIGFTSYRVFTRQQRSSRSSLTSLAFSGREGQRLEPSIGLRRLTFA